MRIMLLIMCLVLVVGMFVLEGCSTSNQNSESGCGGCLGNCNCGGTTAAAGSETTQTTSSNTKTTGTG